MSERRVAWLASINVGKRRATMDVLRSAVETAGFADVATYLASGNVIYTSAADPADDEQRIEHHLAEALGFDVPTFVRSIASLPDTVATPAALLEEYGLSNDGRWHIAFLKVAPSTDRIAAVADLQTLDDRLFVIDDVMFWHRIGGFATSMITTNKLVRALGQQVTVRGLPTVEKLHAKFGGA